MDKIWYRNPSKSEVIGRYGGDEQNRMTTQNRQQSTAKKKHQKTWKAHSVIMLHNLLQKFVISMDSAS